MKHEWIRAAEVFRLAGQSDAFASHSTLAMAICKRARAGMVKAKADRFIVRDNPRDDYEIPPTFWWAEGHEALTQDWRAGDFSTYLDQGKGPQARAFGVSFAAVDIQPIIEGHTDKLGLLAAQRTESDFFSTLPQSSPQANAKAKGGRKPDLVRWQLFYFAAIDLAKAGRLKASQFSSVADLTEELLLCMGDDAFSKDHAEPYVSQIYKRFVEGQ